MESKPFERFLYWIDDAARDTAGQMAVDEALLRSGIDDPLLRVYRWSEPALTTGYFEDAKQARAQMDAQKIPLVRRYTGGGTVYHGSDLPYTIIIPRAVCEDIFGNDRLASYKTIHQALIQTLESLGLSPLVLASERGSGVGVPCFESPVQEDVMHSESGKKIAGAAQRRTRDGMIHQGSVDTLGQELDGERFGNEFASYLADGFQELKCDDLPIDFDDQWQALRASRYATSGWNRDD